jgi:hypothetical protein
MAEIAFALASIARSIVNMKAGTRHIDIFISMVGGAYLLVRGLDNYTKGKRKRGLLARLQRQL